MMEKLRSILKLNGDKAPPTTVNKARPNHVMADEPNSVITVDIDFAPEDPLLKYFLDSPGMVEIERLDFESESLMKLKEAGVKVSVPLISQGELIGLLNLGPRRSEQEYSTDDRRLLNTLATQSASALRVAQLARQQQFEAAEREGLEQELRVARVIQQTLLPNELPTIEGWQISAYWQPARTVGGDFYDFIEFPDGKLGVVIADVTDKGMPAALVMATTRTLLRGSAERLVSPGEVLKHTNDQLCPDIPANMFVTCLYMLLDPGSGEVIFANAGHNLPFQRKTTGIEELRTTGMPLGLMPGMEYAEQRTIMEPGDCLVVYSDGVTESHNPHGEMFGFPRLRVTLEHIDPDERLTEELLRELAEFTGPDWEQEDDVTLVVFGRDAISIENDEFHVLAEMHFPSQPGNERIAMEHVAALVKDLGLSTDRLERLKTAVAEATMNAMEHGNHYQAELPAEIQVLANNEKILVRIRDYGGGQPIPEHEMPDLEAKLAGLQTPRGWGLFLIEKMVDQIHVSSDGIHHTIELIMNLEGE